MSQQNPYLAPQAALSGGGVPMANSALPREMLVVADGMKFILWGIILILITVVVAMVMGASTAGAGAQRGAAAAVEGAKSTEMVVNVLSILAQMLTLFGMFKCTQIPVSTGAKGMAQLAFYGNIVIIGMTLLVKFVPWTLTETTFKVLMILGVVQIILSLVTFFAFLSFLKKTSSYLGDALCIERSSKLFTLTLVGGACYLIIAVFGLAVLFGGFQPGAGMGMLALILGLTALVCAIWGFFVYLGTVTRIRNVIEAGTR